MLARILGLDPYWIRDRARAVLGERGAAAALCAGTAWTAERAGLFLQSEYLRRARGGWFRYEDEELPYFYHPYNATWRNERAIEVPIALRELRRCAAGARVLEVGNVLSHYARVAHDVVDRYERGDGIRNEDVASFRPDRPYDLILSLSTLEHVGRDEPEKEPAKALRALAHLRAEALAPGGRILLTFPLGYNPALDRAAVSGEIPFARRALYRRSGPENRWRESPWEEASRATYDFDRPGADWVVIGILLSAHDPTRRGEALPSPEDGGVGGISRAARRPPTS